MLNEFFISKQRKFRRLCRAPLYSQISPIPGFSGPDKIKEQQEAAEKEKAQKQEKQHKEIRESGQKERQKLAQQRDRISSHQETRVAKEQAQAAKERDTARRKTEEQKLTHADKELLHETEKEKKTQDRYHEQHHSPLIPSSGQARGTGVLQNLYSYTHSASEGNPHEFLQEQLPSLTKSLKQNFEQGGVKLSDLNRGAGFNDEMTGRFHLRDFQNEPSIRRMSGRPFVPETPFGGLKTSPFQPLDFHNIQRLVMKAAEHLPDLHADVLNQLAEKIAVFHKGFLLVKDGDRLRLFRLLRDGTLSESTHDQRGLPLSAQARKAMADALRSRGISARLEGEKQPLVEKQPHSPSSKDHEHKGLRGLLKDGSAFAELLRAALEEGKPIGKKLKKGEEPQFAEKKSWTDFFGRMLGLNNREQQDSLTLDQIKEMIYRGLYKKEGEEGERLVMDLKHLLQDKPGKLKEEKFAQVSGLEDEEFLELLKTLKPGQSIPKDLMEDYLGDRIDFIKLVHVIEKADPALASEILRHVKFNPSASVDPYSQARLEHQIFSQGKKEEYSLFPPPSVLANAFELQPKPKPDTFGKPKLYTLLIYAGGIVSLVLLILYLVGM